MLGGVGDDAAPVVDDRRVQVGDRGAVEDHLRGSTDFAGAGPGPAVLTSSSAPPAAPRTPSPRSPLQVLIASSPARRPTPRGRPRARRTAAASDPSVMDVVVEAPPLLDHEPAGQRRLRNLGEGDVAPGATGLEIVPLAGAPGPCGSSQRSENILRRRAPPTLADGFVRDGTGAVGGSVAGVRASVRKERTSKRSSRTRDRLGGSGANIQCGPARPPYRRRPRRLLGPQRNVHDRPPLPACSLRDRASQSPNAVPGGVKGHCRPQHDGLRLPP